MDLVFAEKKKKKKKDGVKKKQKTGGSEWELEAKLKGV